MSVELVLIPIGIAAIAARRAARATSLCERCRATAVAEVDLLEEVVASLGWRVMEASEVELRAETEFGAATFRRIGEVFLGRVDAAPEATTLAMINKLDHAAGRVAQLRAIQSARENAAAMGLRLLEQVEDGGQVRLVFEEA